MEWTISLVDDRLGRGHATVHERLDDVERFSRAALASAGWQDRAGHRLGAPLAALDGAHAAYLNWVAGPEGYAAQAGMWFNPPVPVEHGAGDIGVLLVNERIVEQPWVFAALPASEPLRVLDVGGSESTVALSLATLGHRVDVVDPRGYPLAHPNLTVHACRLDEFDGAAVGSGPGWDAAVALSCVEHFGLEHYGLNATDRRDDLAALARMRELLRPGGRLVLTVPYGPAAAVDGFERVYDAEGLDELLDGWDVRERLVVERTGRTEWSPRPDGVVAGRAVAMVVARPAPH